MNFGKKTRLGHLVDQFEQAVQKTHRLFHSPSDVLAKCRVIQGSVWPSAFWGALCTAPGLHRMEYLRGNAARAVVGRFHTLSSRAALHLLPGVQDPEVFLMCQQACQLRRLFRCHPQMASAILARATADVEYQSVFGPATAIKVMFERNDWVLLESGWAKGPGHCCFSFRESSPAAIRQAIEVSWSSGLQDALRHRAGLDAIAVPCRSLTQQLFEGQPPWKQSLIARHVCGAFMSGAEKAVWSTTEDGLCSLCGQLDTKEHRLYCCPALQTTREEHLAVLQTARDEFPIWPHLFCATEHASEPLLRLITSTRMLPANIPDRQRLVLFTDGSGYHSSCPPARLTYWSLVRAIDFDALDFSAWLHMPLQRKVAGFRVIVQGGTPGVQSIPRAELAAVAWTARWLKQDLRYEADVFTDSSYVLHVWHQIRAAHGSLDLGCNADLAQHLLHCPNLRLHKVKAHNPAAQAPDASAMLQCTTAGNEAADLAAKAARNLEQAHVRGAADDVAEHYMYQRDHMALFREYLVDVNVAEVRLKAAVKEDHVGTGDYDGRVDDKPFFERCQRHSEEPAFKQRLGPVRLFCGLPYGDEYMLSLHRWASALEWPVPPIRVEHDLPCTYLELAVHQALFCGAMPPVPIFSQGRRRYVAATSREGVLQPQTLHQMVATFQESLADAARATGLQVLPATRLLRISSLRSLGGGDWPE